MALTLEICNRLSDVDPAHWNALVGNGSPFLEWEWLASLEESGCVQPATGWQPQHLLIRDGGDLAAACPLYVKGNSDGEFVFDHGWAEAAHRARVRYYPKLLVAVPFTPATGSRLLTHPAANRLVLLRTLAGALSQVCRDNRLSSIHVNFCLPDETAVLADQGFHSRIGLQFQWINPGWETFDEFLGALRSKRRIQIKRERRELEGQGIDITVHKAHDIEDGLFGPMFDLYRSTIDKLVWGRQYLNEAFFDLLRSRWKERLCFFIARRHGEILAGTFTVHKGDTLYGRYWGAFEPVRYLHFNVCYYAAIEYCLRAGIPRFEPGAGGEFKHLRGFDARPTTSMHFVADPRLAAAVDDYLSRERQAVSAEIAWWDAQSVLKKPPSGPALRL